MSTPTEHATATTLLRVEGRDALDVLHRISTQSLTDLAPGQARVTLFCDFRGRMLHRAVVARAGDCIWLLRDDAAPEALLAHIDRHVFREDLRMQVVGEPGAVVRVRAQDVPAGTVLAIGDQPARVTLADGTAYAVGDAARGLDPENDVDRIRAGRPRHGHEIHDAFHPFEVGLQRDVHLNKGCFTGQEVLLRLMTYDSVRRRLVRITGTGDAPAVPQDVTLAFGAAGAAAGIGRLTSAAPDTGGGWTGLAVLRYEHAAPGTPLSIAGAAVTLDDAFPIERPLGLP